MGFGKISCGVYMSKLSAAIHEVNIKERDLKRLGVISRQLNNSLGVSYSRAGYSFWLDNLWVYRNYMLQVEIKLLRSKYKECCVGFKFEGRIYISSGSTLSIARPYLYPIVNKISGTLCNFM